MVALLLRHRVVGPANGCLAVAVCIPHCKDSSILAPELHKSGSIDFKPAGCGGVAAEKDGPWTSAADQAASCVPA